MTPTFPVTLTITLTTPRRGILARFRPIAVAEQTVDVPLPMHATPEGMTEDGDALVRYTIDPDALSEDLTERVGRAVAAFTTARSTP